ncbi:Gp138 family membrane-puncturing spike protein [Paenibacillus radicis (ex Xue et al. 2023)]|uniref:Phage protein Gp138 N-terminal domain-containing protein n=1 Tax=Paenibacillus radicis (ex Xue et al. 2023) TaxID=2972489 RepID=A0ABT1YSM6_9BACL|nr:Gp138 family membrane-puncturing spike protein [Paenibacillus radicis (ex Xue et al. 2023)]MCR8636189.1 hypothetical protein [Paenibacillus radicis (ex Xue et al. 2023)]
MSATDAGSAANAFVAGMVEKAINDLYVCFPCRVISFDSASGMAVVQPLFRKADKEPALIQNVPAIGQKHIVKEHEQTIVDQGIERTIIIKEHEEIHFPNVKSGDTVLVVCADGEIRNTLSGQVAIPVSKRMHSKNDAVIVGVLPCSLLS